LASNALLLFTLPEDSKSADVCKRVDVPCAPGVRLALWKHNTVDTIKRRACKQVAESFVNVEVNQQNVRFLSALK